MASPIDVSSPGEPKVLTFYQAVETASINNEQTDVRQLWQLGRAAQVETTTNDPNGTNGSNSDLPSIISKPITKTINDISPLPTDNTMTPMPDTTKTSETAINLETTPQSKQANDNGPQEINTIASPTESSMSTSTELITEVSIAISDNFSQNSLFTTSLSSLTDATLSTSSQAATQTSDIVESTTSSTTEALAINDVASSRSAKNLEDSGLQQPEVSNSLDSNLSANTSESIEPTFTAIEVDEPKRTTKLESMSQIKTTTPDNMNDEQTSVTESIMKSLDMQDMSKVATTDKAMEVTIIPNVSLINDILTSISTAIIVPESDIERTPESVNITETASSTATPLTTTISVTEENEKSTTQSPTTIDSLNSKNVTDSSDTPNTLDVELQFYNDAGTENLPPVENIFSNEEMQLALAKFLNSAINSNPNIASNIFDNNFMDELAKIVERFPVSSEIPTLLNVDENNVDSSSDGLPQLLGGFLDNTDTTQSVTNVSTVGINNETTVVAQTTSIPVTTLSPERDTNLPITTLPPERDTILPITTLSPEKVTNMPTTITPLEQVTNMPTTITPLEQVTNMPTTITPLEQVTNMPTTITPLEQVTNMPTTITPLEQDTHMPTTMPPPEPNTNSVNINTNTETNSLSSTTTTQSNSEMFATTTDPSITTSLTSDNPNSNLTNITNKYAPFIARMMQIFAELLDAKSLSQLPVDSQIQELDSLTPQPKEPLLSAGNLTKTNLMDNSTNSMSNETQITPDLTTVIPTLLARFQGSTPATAQRTAGTTTLSDQTFTTLNPSITSPSLSASFSTTPNPTDPSFTNPQSTIIPDITTTTPENNVPSSTSSPTTLSSPIVFSTNIPTTIPPSTTPSGIGRFGTSRLTPSPPFTPSSSTTAPLRDYLIYGIYPNKTIVRKRPEDNLIDARNVDSPYVIFGIYPDGKLVRKFPNGTVIPDPPSNPVEVVFSLSTTTTTNRPRLPDNQANNQGMPNQNVDISNNRSPVADVNTQNAFFAPNEVDNALGFSGPTGFDLPLGSVGSNIKKMVYHDHFYLTLRGTKYDIAKLLTKYQGNT